MKTGIVLMELPFLMESCLRRPWVDVLTLTKVFGAVMLPIILEENSLTKPSLTEPWVENKVFAAVLTNSSRLCYLHMHSGQGLNVAPFCRVVNLLVDFFDKTDFQIHF